MIGNTQDFKSEATFPQPSGLTIVYVVFVSVALFVYHWIAEGEFSSVITLSALFELLALCLLGVHVFTTRSVHGISAKSLQLEGIALVCRLSSTTWLLGYMPADASGDYLYQTIDILSVVMVLGLLHQMLSVHRETYDADQDILPVFPFVAGTFILACFLHADLDQRPIFDIMWTMGVFLQSVAPVPYLWLMAHNKGAIPALTCHFVAVMAISRLLSGSFMWDAHAEFTCVPYFGDFNHAGWAVMVAHAVHLMLLADFGYFYVKNVINAGLQSPMELAESWMV